ncbi:unnamed protein product, partial [Rotaria sordida]
SKSIACMILSPDDRKSRGIKGVTQEIFNEWITSTLASAINQLYIDNMYLICDKSRSHNRTGMRQTL